VHLTGMAIISRMEDPGVARRALPNHDSASVRGLDEHVAFFSQSYAPRLSRGGGGEGPTEYVGSGDTHGAAECENKKERRTDVSKK